MQKVKARIIFILLQVHFGRLNMKPGKPTTFASINRANGSRCFFFGLPGNPVSCLVTCALMVTPAVKILKGVPLAQCLHTQIQAKLVGSDLKLDPERVEYHRYYIPSFFPSFKLLFEYILLCALLSLLTDLRLIY